MQAGGHRFEPVHLHQNVVSYALWVLGVLSKTHNAEPTTGSVWSLTISYAGERKRKIAVGAQQSTGLPGLWLGSQVHAKNMAGQAMKGTR